MRAPTHFLGSVLVIAVAFGFAEYASAQDEALFSASGGAPPNILLLLDSSGSMGKAPRNCTGCDIKRNMANRAILSLVTSVNPADGAGGYVNNARLGFAIFTKEGAHLLVPVGDDTVGEIVTWVSVPDIATAASNIKAMGGNSHGLAMMEMGRYFAHPETWAGFPPWGFASVDYAGPAYTGTADPTDFPNENPTLDSVWDLACRPSFLIHIDDGLWGGNDGARFGDCGADTCALTNIGDLSGDGEFWMEDISLAMFEHDFSDENAGGFAGLQNVVTYVIGFDEPEAADLMRIAAELGGGSFFFASNETELEEALFSITVNIFESVASFAGVAVPSSRSSSGSALYNAYFEPRNNESIWAGHLEAYGLARDGTILNNETVVYNEDGSIANRSVVEATDVDGALIDWNSDPNIIDHKPLWDAGPLLAANTSRVVYTSPTSGSAPVLLSTTSASMADLAIAPPASGPAPPPVADPPPDTCVTTAALIPEGWDFQLINPNTLPDVLLDTTVEFKYCVPPDRDGLDKDKFGTFLVTDSHTEAIELKKRKKDKAICKYAGDGVTVTGGHERVNIKVGKQEGEVHVRFYKSSKQLDKKGKLKDTEDFSDEGLVGYSVSACIKIDAAPPNGGGGTPAPPANPDFAPYPNSATSGIDTYEELHEAIIQFAWGKDPFDQDGDANTTENRSVVLGDIFHSTPLVIGQPPRAHEQEYGFKGSSGFKATYDDRDRVIYVGANDGMLHAFHAGEMQEGDDSATLEIEDGYYDHGNGGELFGYVPRLLLDKIKFLSHNIPRSLYFVDAPPVAADAWFDLNSDSKKTVDEWATVLIAGLREGGAGYFALDVTNPAAIPDGPVAETDPHYPYPKLLWEFTHAKLGEAWSEPVITRVKIEGASGDTDHCGINTGDDGNCIEKWVAVFGGGYAEAADPNHFSYEGDPAADGWIDQGKAIFMVDLQTGDVLASVEFDAADTTGPAAMKYAIPSAPAVLDLDFDGFADVVYIGDLGGQMWRWDISNVGQDTSGSDGIIDDWDVGIFFDSGSAELPSGETHYRSIFFPPAATFVHGRLTLAFGTGEREELRYEGTTADDENRFYVLRDDDHPPDSSFSSVLTESDISGSDITDAVLGDDGDNSDAGFFYQAEEGEKFITNVAIFAGHVIVATYTPVSGDDLCTTAGGQAFLHVFRVDNGLGAFPNESTTDPAADRRMGIGGGLPGSPRVSLAPDPEDDTIYIKTSTGHIITFEPPERLEDGAGAIYWRQKF